MREHQLVVAQLKECMKENFSLKQKFMQVQTDIASLVNLVKRKFTKKNSGFDDGENLDDEGEEGWFGPVDKSKDISPSIQSTHTHL
jgi:hypothetical protein